MKKQMDKNTKLRNISLALAGIAAIGSTTLILSNSNDAKAIISKLPKTSTTVKTNTVLPKATKPNFKIQTSKLVNTSRVLNGAPGSINSGRVTSNGLSYQGNKLSSNKVNTQSSTSTTLNKTQTSNTSTTLNQTKPSKAEVTLKYKGTVQNKVNSINASGSGKLTLKDGAHKEQAYSNKGNGDKVVTTEGFYRK